ncbi:Polyadenylate-binding protein 7 [Camellia lanceoleosa]|uniref:Polyadenylate-binding protein 7 n=1 Tax=Camellia lanceoleosa TaxID=1840588 RepID=A0ACC0GV59_9ERIC|nr:Polyadenylate-binding protein 7 [Camellia lanceoleosa]
MAAPLTVLAPPALLYVGDLHHDTTDSQLFDHFSEFKSLASVHVYHDSSIGRSLCYGYVNFISSQDDGGSREQAENGDDDVAALVGNEVYDEGDTAVKCTDPRNDDWNGREKEASCKSTSGGAHTVSDMGKAIPGEACESREVARVLSSSNVQNGVDRPVDGDFSNPGLLKSLSGSRFIKAGLNIEVVLTKAHELNNAEGPVARNGRVVSSEILGSSAESIQKRAADKRVQIHDLPSNYQKKKGSLQRDKSMAGTSLNLKKAAVFRSAVAALSLSATSESNNRRLLLTEAEASLQIGRILGVNCEGNDDVVLSKLMDLEVNDKEKLRNRGGDAC